MVGQTSFGVVGQASTRASTGVMWGILLLVLSNLCMAGTAGGGGSWREVAAHKRQSVQYSTLVGPSFLNASAHAYAHAPIGKTAHLTCIVNNLHNYTVSWVRARDIHLLTAGLTTYTSDDRFVSVNPGGGSRWLLRIHHARASDAGTYLCQVSLSPPISTPVTLLVTEATARVYPGGEVFLRESSKVVLVCEVRGCPFPAHPTWYKRQHQVTEGTTLYEGSVSEKSGGHSSPAITSLTPSPTLTPPKRRTHQLQVMPTVAVGRRGTNPTPPTPGTTTPTPIGLPIARVTMQRHKASSHHSGLYICTNTCTPNINLTLHVLSGDEETAAMQHPSSSLSFHPATPTVLSLSAILLCQCVLS